MIPHHQTPAVASCRATAARLSLSAALALLVAVPGLATAQSGPFTLAQVKSYAFPNALAASPRGTRLAWALQEQGQRNIYVAEGPTFTARRLTNYRRDDGQELTSVGVSADGQWVVYLRGGDHGSNYDDALPVNVNADPVAPKVQVWSMPFAGGEPHLLGEGENPVIAPSSDAVLLERERAIWRVPIDGSKPAVKLIAQRGNNSDAVYSPDGRRIAFTCDRGDHAFIGIYENDSTPIRWMAPSTSNDFSARWSPDGSRVVFVRMPGAGGAPDSILARRHTPWALWTADTRTGAATMLWTAPRTLRGSYPSTDGGANLHWGAGNHIAFLSYHDGWPHLYSISAAGGAPLLLTPGNFMVEHITMSADGTTLVGSANTGPDVLDLDRRHVLVVPIDRAAMRVLTPGAGLEWTPVVLGDNATVGYLAATAQRPPLATVMPLAGGSAQSLGADRIPADYPVNALVTPRQVVFKAADGVTVHAQLFEPKGPAMRRPAIVYVHGGPPRQMLLGWHYSDYYANAYASNQYLASQGYVVLSVNYRLGIGYGYEFHQPPNAGAKGGAEYLDVKAGAEWLRAQPGVIANAVGIYGGSYGGYLTAMALSHNSDLFAAGVDIHGVHDWTSERARGLLNRERFEEAPDLARALRVAWESSPISAMATWRSPVLLLHGDDDRNVRFTQTTDLVQRLRKKGVTYEEHIIPDDTHHFMRHANWVTVDSAAAEFFGRTLKKRQVVP